MDIYVVDTSSLLRNEDLFNCIRNGEIIIHLIVLEELDSISKKKGQKAQKARTIAEKLYKWKNRGSYRKGIKVSSNIIRFDDRLPNPQLFLRFGMDINKEDNLLICVAKEIQEETEKKVILVTNDRFFTLKAEMDLSVQTAPTTKYKKHKPKKHKGYVNAAPVYR